MSDLIPIIIIKKSHLLTKKKRLKENEKNAVRGFKAFQGQLFYLKYFNKCETPFPFFYWFTMDFILPFL